ncbi:Yop protein translocation protein I [compost metagenome]
MDISTIEKATQTTLQAVGPAQTDDQLVAQFEQALASGGTSQASGVLNTISDMTAQISQAKQDLRGKMAAPVDASPSTLMEMQYQLMQINLQEELIAKGVGRLTQNVETLMKMQ